MDKKLKCYISADISTNLENLSMALKDSNIQVIDKYVKNNDNDIITIIKEADFTIGVLYNSSPNVYFELGICEALKIPVYIIKDNDSIIPNQLQNNINFSSSLNDKIFLKNVISKIEDNYKKRKKRKAVNKHKANKNIVDLQEFISEIDRCSSNWSGKDFELFLARVFNYFSLEFEANQWNEQSEIDFMIWPDTIHSKISRIIIVEAKFGNISQAAIEKAYKKTVINMGNLNADIGLILYYNPNKKKSEHDNMKMFPNVIVYDIKSLLEECLSLELSLIDIIIRKRNEIAHGRGM